MTVTVIQPAKPQLTAEAYDIDKLIAVVNMGTLTQTYITIAKQQSAKHDYYVFEITQVASARGQEITVAQKRTTHYHKAIGIAVTMNA